MPQLTLRAVEVDDDQLIDALVVARAPELATLPPEIQHMQRVAQEQAYAAAAGRHRHVMIDVDGRAVGRVWSVMNDDALTVLDLVVLPSNRGQGIGTAVMTRLLDEAAVDGLPVRLQVSHDNVPARRLYERLGFQATEGGDPLYQRLEWRHDRT